MTKWFVAGSVALWTHAWLSYEYKPDLLGFSLLIAIGCTYATWAYWKGME